MFDIKGVVTQLEGVLAELDPTALDADTAVEATDVFDHIERLAAAGKALVAGRIDETGAWRKTGARDAIGFLAARTRCPRARVRDGLAAAQLGSMPLVNQALRGGELTIDGAADIAVAVAEHPEAETELVALARTATTRQLKERCLQILAQGQGAEQQHRRATAERSATSTVGRDGIWRLSTRLPVIDGALVDKTLDYFQTQIFDHARQQGDREPFDAYRADALVAMAQTAMGQDCAGTCTDASDETDGQHRSGNRSKRRRRHTRSSSIRHAIIITVPHSVFRTGTPGAGETCEVPGVGPVPASQVHQLMNDDPIIKAIVTKGRDITAVATPTRSIKEDLRLAVLAANDLTCAVATCDNMRFLELDHHWEYHKGGPTSYDNLRPLCSYHHDQRTNHDYQLRGTPGTYEWIAPDGTILAAERSATPI